MKITFKDIGEVIIETDCDKTHMETMVKSVTGNKQPYIMKWIQQKKQGDVFTVDDFYREYPKLKTHKESRVIVERSISDLIKKRVIVQMGNDKFKVN